METETDPALSKSVSVKDFNLYRQSRRLRAYVWGFMP